MKIIFASNNKRKADELQALLHPFHIDIIPQSTLNVPEVEETATTFVENALIKARHATQCTGLPAIADDSGIEVFALHGKPGIYSARYARKNATADENNQKLLQELDGIPVEKRNARFYCALVFMADAQDPTPLICEGTWSGFIVTEAKNRAGFGYDPIFYVPSDDCTAAELTVDRKNQLSHRGQALRLFIEKLPNKIHYDKSTYYQRS